ncbi:MAG: hypothetical protein PHY80_05405 [Rickettsiales bacterium]|nr:hypothetical protein [Rickettsiales bacterium]
MMTEKLKELNNLLNEKIDNNKRRSENPYAIVKDEISDIERKILEEKLFQIEKKAFQYATNNNFRIKQDLATLRMLLRFIDRTHQGKKPAETMIRRVENLLESVVKKS